ncbi:FAD synthetase [Dendrobium catenatum]|uniref:FAD synthase n=1 Tax=Dendrobium catenatum TaxID=906689 RepID=A0A2I0VTI1_9ASPA|nr:FAD synthetase [Dendrobium catenatum]
MGSFNGNMDSVLKCPIRTIYFETSSAFPEINSFTYETAASYDLQLDIIRLDFKSGLETLLKEKPTKAIFLGTRIGDPNAIGQEQFSPSSTGWPPFMRVNPILDWSYRDVWAFILTCKVPYCSLYDKGYTSIGSIYDTEPNALLCIPHQSGDKENFKPAYCLSDGRLERAGRAKKLASKNDNIPIMSNGLKNTNPHQSCSFSASIIAVGDEILFGSVEEKIGATLCKKLNAIGWRVSHIAVVGNDIDLIADELEHRNCKDDLIFLFGALGPLHSDVSLAGVAKAFGVRLAPDEEFEEYLRHIMGNHGTGNRNEVVEPVLHKTSCKADRGEGKVGANFLAYYVNLAVHLTMALLPEGITELLHHDKLVVPLIKCCNVMLLSATNTDELEQQWDCLLQLCSSPLVQMGPFISKQLSTKLYDVSHYLTFTSKMVEIAAVLTKLCLDFPDIHIGCHRQSRAGPLIINFVGKDHERIELASRILSQKFDFGSFSELSSG